MDRFDSLSQASAQAVAAEWSIGKRVRVHDAEYVLDRLASDGPEWRLVPAQPGALGERKDAPANGEGRKYTLPNTSDERKEVPIAEGVLYYFPAALAEVAQVSKRGNDKHNLGEPLHHSRGKSMDHADCQLRHMIDARESRGVARTEHLAAKAWRALAELQEHCEAMGAPLAPNARAPE